MNFRENVIDTDEELLETYGTHLEDLINLSNLQYSKDIKKLKIQLNKTHHGIKMVLFENHSTDDEKKYVVNVNSCYLVTEVDENSVDDVFIKQNSFLCDK